MSNEAAPAKLAKARAEVSRAAGELALARSRYLSATDADAARAAYYAAVDALAEAAAALERARRDVAVENEASGARVGG